MVPPYLKVTGTFELLIYDVKVPTDNQVVEQPK
jgi:hypothetical protein